ncbi:MAG: histone deacetylase [Thermoleophilaceae bacterium]
MSVRSAVAAGRAPWTASVRGDFAAEESTGRGYGNGIAAPLYLRHPASLDHDTGAHPERADRVRAVEAALARRDWLGWDVREAPRASDEQLLRIHSRAHLDGVRDACAAGRRLDPDTPVVPASWDAALRSAGGACALAEALLAGSAPTGVAALRPPGHHAEPERAMGFCLLSNVAIAARHALDALGAERVLILDWDVHHGNGTQAAFDADPAVLFVSLHRWPFYPGTGAAEDAGSGAGAGYTVNLPLAAGTGEDEWLALVEHVAIPVAREYGPDLILVSAGYDAHRDDPLGGCLLEAGSYAQMARHVQALAGELGVPAGAVLEGGYDLDALGSSVVATMEALAGGGGPRHVDPGPLVERAAAVVGRHWPVLSR